MTFGSLVLSLSVLLAQDYAANPPAAARDLSTVRELYAAASYEEALVELAGFDNGADVVQVEQYRALCLLGLGRMDEAALSLERMVTAQPLYRIDGAGVSPRLVSMFQDVRLRILPERAKQLYETATASFDAERYEDATTQFETLLTLLDDESLISRSETFADMQRLASGFLRLAKVEAAEAAAQRTRMAEAARAAAAAAAAPPPPAEPVIYDTTDADVVAPVDLDRRMPAWNPPTPLAAAGEHRGVLQIVIDERGRVERAALLRSVAAFYDRALLEAATTWKFEPATRHGTPVKYRKSIEVVGSSR
jgi:TonB family protein